MSDPFPHDIGQCRVMVFVDGEGFACRYGAELGGKAPPKHVKYEPDVFVWSGYLNLKAHVMCRTIRRYYYTSVKGDEKKRKETEEALRAMGIQAPRVFPR